MGYYHMRQIASLGRIENVPGSGSYFSSVQLYDGEQPVEKPFPKDEFLYLSNDGTGRLLDDEVGVKDLMEFQRTLYSMKRSLVS